MPVLQSRSSAAWTRVRRHLIPRPARLGAKFAVPSHPYDNPIHTTSAEPQVSVQIVVPARNEEECIGRCLDSLVRQQGIAFAITVVNDGSHNRTRPIAQSSPALRLIHPPPLPPATPA